MRGREDKTAVTTTLAALATAARPELLTRWRRVHGAPPPKSLSIGFLRKALSYEAQVAACGGSKPQVLRDLKRLATSDMAASPKAGLAPGTQLVREWNGRTYRVTVSEANVKDPAQTTLRLIARVDLGPAHILLALDAIQLAQILEIDPEVLDDAHLAWKDAFTLKRRGVETRIILGQAGANIDPVLLRNIHQARLWYGEIIAGKTIAQLTARDGVCRGRLSRHLDLAFLAPDLLAQITTGHQPTGFTSEWLKTHDLPADWDAQRVLFNAL